MEKNDLKERIIKNSFWGFVSALANRTGSLIFTIILARFLLPEGFGVYSIVLSITMILYTFTDLGVNQTLVRYISYTLSRNRKKIPSYYRYLLKIKFILSISASLLLFILAYPLSFYVFKNSALFLPLLVSSFYIFVMSFEGFYSYIFYSVEKVFYLGLREFLYQTLRVVSSILVFYFVASSYQIVGIFLSLSFCSLLILFFVFFYLKKLIPQLYERPKVKIDKKKIKRFVGFMTIASISGAFFLYTDTIIMGIFLLPEYVGYYRVASSVILSASGIIGSLTAILLPVFTKLKNSNNLFNIFNSIFRHLLVLIIPSTFGLWLFGRYILLIFGYSYLSAYLPLLFLSPLVFLQLGVGLFTQLFSAKGKPQIFARLILITCIINIFLNFLFIRALLLISPLWATAGAGIATSLSWSFYFFGALYVSKKKFNLNLSVKPAIKPLIASLIMSAFLIFLISFIEDMNLFSGIFLISCGTIIYFIFMILLKGVTKTDLDLFKLLIKKKNV